MSSEFRTPDPGEGIHEVEVVELYVSEGDRVNEGDPLMAAESDKATVDVPASFTGTIDSIEVAEGDVVEVGSVLLTYSEGGSEGGETRPKSGKDEPGTGEERARDKQANEQEAGEPGEKAAREQEARERGSEEKEAGEKEAGEEARAQPAKEAEAPRPGRASRDESSRQQQDERPRRRESVSSADIEASPSTRRLARELGIALADVPGSGPGGRVLGRDVRNAVRHQRGPEGRRPAPPLPDFSRWGEVSREPLRGIRRATAQRMARSWETIPHVTHTRIADVTALEAFRKEHVGDLEAKLTLTVLVVKALAAALGRFPRFNASLDTDADEIVYKHYCHIGVAVATDHGLLVPVLRDADRKTLRDLAGELEALSERARSRRLTGDEMRGGSISVTNVGGVGGDHFTPIINHPEAAILGMGALREVPVLVRDGEAQGGGGEGEPRLEGRLQLPLIVGFDHRLNDGMDAAGFANAIAEPLTDPGRLLLDT